MAKHGTRSRYLADCRCDECKEAQRLYQRRYRERRANGLTRPCVAVQAPESGAGQLPVLGQLTGAPNVTRGPVEQAVESELGGLPAAQLRPALVAIAAAMARVLDSTPPTPKPSAAKVLVTVLDMLRKSAQGRRGNLAVVREMADKGAR
jgi:hypothetical protein